MNTGKSTASLTTDGYAFTSRRTNKTHVRPYNQHDVIYISWTPVFDRTDSIINWAITRRLS